MRRRPLILRNLTFAYGREADAAPVIENLDLRIRHGEILLVCGYSGSGKSTLLKLINGVIPFVQHGQLTGELRLGDRDLSALSVSERARWIGSVFQNPREQIVFDKLIDEVVFPMENLALDRDEMHRRSRRILERLRLAPEARTATLSGGEQQKLITAATLAMQQDILLLDEPLANLDQDAALELLQLLRQLADQKDYAIVLVEHRLDLVRDYVDRVLAFADGHRLYPSAAEFFAALDAADSQEPQRGVEPTEDSDKPVLLKLRDVGCAFGERVLFSKVNLTVHESDRLVILGDNGCGKTTLLDIIAGLKKPTRGSVTRAFGKRDLGHKVGMVLQNPDYQLFMPTVREELSLTSADRAWTDYLIRHFKFEPLLERSPFSLSEGQKRKLGFACILARRPDLLLLDEPTVGLDDAGMYQLLEALERYGREHSLTLISVSHDRRAIPLLGDRYFRLDLNRPVEPPPCGSENRRCF